MEEAIRVSATSLTSFIASPVVNIQDLSLLINLKSVTPRSSQTPCAKLKAGGCQVRMRCIYEGKDAAEFPWLTQSQTTGYWSADKGSKEDTYDVFGPTGKSFEKDATEPFHRTCVLD